MTHQSQLVLLKKEAALWTSIAWEVKFLPFSNPTPLCDTFLTKCQIMLRSLITWDIWYWTLIAMGVLIYCTILKGKWKTVDMKEKGENKSQRNQPSLCPSLSTMCLWIKNRSYLQFPWLEHLLLEHSCRMGWLWHLDPSKRRSITCILLGIEHSQENFLHSWKNKERNRNIEDDKYANGQLNIKECGNFNLSY